MAVFRQSRRDPESTRVHREFASAWRMLTDCTVLERRVDIQTTGPAAETAGTGPDDVLHGCFRFEFPSRTEHRCGDQALTAPTVPGDNRGI